MSQGPVPTGMAGAAANPHTTPENLRQIAYHYPELRPIVAENPGAYDGLVEWLHQFDDPAIEAAIQRRLDRQAQQAQHPQGPAGVPAQPFPAPTDPTLTPPLGVQAQRQGRGHTTRIVVTVLAVLAIALCTIALLIVTGVIGGGNRTGAGTAASGDSASSGMDGGSTDPAGDPSAAEVQYPAPGNAIHMDAFTSPSGNVSCTLTDNVASCTIYAQNYASKGLQTCPERAGFVVDGTSAHLDCGVAFDPIGDSLEYGSIAVNGDVACSSDAEGISCWNQRTGSAVAFAREGWRTGTSGRILTGDFRF